MRPSSCVLVRRCGYATGNQMSFCPFAWPLGSVQKWAPESSLRMWLSLYLCFFRSIQFCLPANASALVAPSWARATLGFCICLSHQLWGCELLPGKGVLSTRWTLTSQDKLTNSWPFCVWSCFQKCIYSVVSDSLPSSWFILQYYVGM